MGLTVGSKAGFKVIGLLIVFAGMSLGTILAAGSNWWEAGKQEENSSSVTQQVVFKEQPKGKSLSMTDWKGGNIAVKAAGAADLRSSANMAQAKIMAGEAARAMAALQIAEIVKGLQINAHTTVQDAMVKNQTVNTSVDAFLVGVRYSEPIPYPQPDGSLIVEVVAHLGMFGAGGVIDTIEEGLPKAEPPKPTVPIAPKPSEPFTGVIVDASGLQVRPGLAPRILTGGHEVYNGAGVSRDYLLKENIVGYAKSVDDARANTDRVGKNPLVVKASGSDEKNGVNVVVAAEDAGKIFRADEDGRALKEARVIFVLN